MKRTEEEQVQHAEIVAGILRNDSTAKEALYEIVQRFTNFLKRQLGAEDLEDHLHAVYVALYESLAAGKLRDSASLIPYVVTTVRFYCYNEIESRQRRRKVLTPSKGFDIADCRENTLHGILHHQQRQLIRKTMRHLPRKERFVLRRFYLAGQPREHIETQMGLTPTQFRLLKTKAKANLTKRLAG